MDVEPNSVNELDDFEDDALWSRHSRPFSVRRSSASLWLVDRVPVVSSRGWSSWPHTGSSGVRPHLGGEGGGQGRRLVRRAIESSPNNGSTRAT
jgi:hypothetical protein